MSNLLQVARLHPKALQKSGAVPLMVEAPVAPETAPYLVTGASEPFLWVEEPHPGDVVKAAVRDIKSPGDIFLGVVQIVAERGKRDQWGNVHPFTLKGLKDAIDHLKYYEFTDLEVLVPRLKDDQNPKGPKNRPKWLAPKEVGAPFRLCSWLPGGFAVVVPKDRGFVGILQHVTPKKVFVLVHNASRGLGISCGDPA